MFDINTPRRPLRSENKLLLLPPRTNTIFATNNIAVQGFNYWNHTTLDLKQTPTMNQYKYNLKPYGNDMTEN